ncbi:MAG: T9SS type A sorting domain-containing protein [Bacteroidales bacterium]|nr:T9SS type A sorting domain-containing protein [Bacteroidales bacterium]
MKIAILFFTGLAFLLFKSHSQTVTDKDSNVYNTITIGTQVWLKENLKVTKYNDGTAIPLVTDSIAWSDLTTPGYCWYNNDKANYQNPYGALYNWITVNTGKLCPTGWHVPSDAEWTTLITYLGGDSVAGGKLKETGTAHWNFPNTGATNETDFTAVAGGYRHGNGTFDNLGHDGYFYSSTGQSSGNCGHQNITCYNSYSYNEYFYKTYGMSVRCLINSTTLIFENNLPQDIKIYPNPAIDRIYINCADRQNAIIRVYNISGKCILQYVLNDSTNYIDITSFPKGIYVVRIFSKNRTIQQKFIKD